MGAMCLLQQVSAVEAQFSPPTIQFINDNFYPFYNLKKTDGLAEAPVNLKKTDGLAEAPVKWLTSVLPPSGYEPHPPLKGNEDKKKISDIKEDLERCGFIGKIIDFLQESLKNLSILTTKCDEINASYLQFFIDMKDTIQSYCSEYEKKLEKQLKTITEIDEIGLLNSEESTKYSAFLTEAQDILFPMVLCSNEFLMLVNRKDFASCIEKGLQICEKIKKREEKNLEEEVRFYESIKKQNKKKYDKKISDEKSEKECDHQETISCANFLIKRFQEMQAWAKSNS